MADYRRNPGRRTGILVRTALFAWLVSSATLAVFIAMVVPGQKATFLENLASKARGVSASLQAVAAGAAVSEDYSEVVDHCTKVLAEDPSIEYLVLTRLDGFSIVHDRKGWRNETLGPAWRPPDRVARGGITVSALVGHRVFQQSSPFEYSGLEWGWVHVGLSLDSYDRSVSALYHKTALAILLCLGLGLIASMMYARRLTRPIVHLRQAVQQVANGDLGVRACIDSQDEVGALARSFNQMAESLCQHDQILRSIHFAAQQFLSAEDWHSVIERVLTALGQASGVSRLLLFENRTSETGTLVASPIAVWCGPGAPSPMEQPRLRNLQLFGGDHDRWTDLLCQGKPVVGNVADLPPQERPFLEAQNIKSLVVVPVVVSGDWWGFIGFDDCSRERTWSEAEVVSLCAAADTLGAAIERHRAGQALLVAKETAESASKAKSQFLANMSHEIRTPITGVMGMLHLLRRTQLLPRQKRYVGHALTAAETLLTVLGDVLDFSKIEAGRLELEEEVFSLPDLLDGAMRIFAERAEGKGVELIYRLDPSVPAQALGDGNRFRQILVNLLGNALKFTEQGRILVDCTMEEEDEAEALVRVEVSDTGCGIARAKQELIFDAFSQADSSMTRAYGGTGLGLAICRQLCELMGGAIGVESEPGRGSRFWFTARLRQCRERAPAAPIPPSGADPLRVLIVDDCDLSRKVVREYVESWKGMAEEAADAAVALEKLRRACRQGQPFSLAMLDWRMPGVDGMALARLIREDELLGSTGLILLSGFADSAPDCEVAAGLFAACVPKPVRKSDLYDAVMIAKRSASGPYDSPVAPPPVRETNEDAGRLRGRVLLVEDNEINREVAGELIGFLGCTVLYAHNGRQAVELVRSEPVDLVLMDCQMPVMDGYEATRLLRQREKEGPSGLALTRLPIVALTAHAMKGDREVCLNAGMDDFLTKPLDPANLAAALKKWLPRGEPFAEPVAKVLEIRPAPVEATATIDREDLVQRCMGKAAMADRLIKKFAELGPAYVQEVLDAVANGDAATLRAKAHRLKGAAASVSARPVSRLAAELEILGQEDNLSDSDRLAAELSAEWNRFLEEHGGAAQAA